MDLVKYSRCCGLCPTRPSTVGIIWSADDKENLLNFNLIRDLSRGADPSVSYSSCTRVEMFAKSCNYAASSSSRVSSCISNSIPVSYVGDDLS